MIELARGAAIILLVCATTGMTLAEAPNIILVLTDDQGWSQMSVSMDPAVESARSSFLETPHMARLARHGMRFSAGYAAAPMCTPSRRSILFGTTAARSGTEFRSGWAPDKHLTIPGALKSLNPDYRSAHFGKWGALMNATPESCGYDASDGMTTNDDGGMPISLGVKSGLHKDAPPYFIDNEDPKLTRSVTSRAIEFIRQQVQDKKPFFVQVSYYAVHVSVVTREKTLAKYLAKGTPDRGYTAAWAAMLEELDDGVGRLIDTVEKLGIADNTYIFLTSDNGGRKAIPGGDDARTATNTPLSGSKHSLYEGGIRVPFIAWGPGIAANSVCRSPVAGYDLLPTFHELAGGRSEDLPEEVDGRSLKALLNGARCDSSVNADRALFFHFPRTLVSAVRDGRYKLIVRWNRDGSVEDRELYDVGSNPREEDHDIGKDKTAIADALEKRLLEHLKAVDAAMPASEPPPPAPKRKRRQ